MARDEYATDDFLRDQTDRTQRHRTRQRREGRFQQRRIYLLGALLLLAMLILGAPSFVSHSPLGRSLVSEAAADLGITLDVDTVRVGWMTPLRLTGLQIHSSRDGNHFRVEQIDSTMTVTDLMRGSTSQLGQISVRGVDILCTMHDGRCSLEDDLSSLLEPSDSAEPQPSGLVSVQDIKLAVTDVVTGKTWQIAQSNAEVEIKPDSITADFAGVLSEPSGDGGSLQGTIAIMPQPAGRGAHQQPTANSSETWNLKLDSESLPLSVVALVRRRFPEAAASIPMEIAGNTTGAIRLAGFADGTIAATIDQLHLRHLQASDPAMGNRIWSNQAASVNGELMLTPNRVHGRNLQASTDFASAKLDGSFARSMTLTGVNDNPLSWLDAIDGSASMQVDLAAFDQSLPGMLPLRNQARIVSGRINASVESIPNGRANRSQLSLRSDPIRASAPLPGSSRDQTVVIEPVELSAVVSRENGILKADQFRWKSAFASIVGQGDLRSGAADLEIDFGRLASMLRPIIELSETELDGVASGNIKWNASGDRLWQLIGSGNASNVQVTLPGGALVRQPNLRGNINATGRWGDGRLDELTEATIKLVSGGLDVHAELTQPVRDPSPQTPIPVRIESSGRLEALAAAISPWLPADVHDADGGFVANMRGEVSTIAGQLTQAAIELDKPRIAYGDRWFEQPNIKIHFDGSAAWPSGDLDARSFTLAGDAVSAGIRGVSGAEMTALEVAWRAKLERIQGSVRQRIANRSTTSFTQVGFRSGANVESDEWLIMGDFDGKLLVNRSGDKIELDSYTTGKNVAIVQPHGASANAQTVGPMPLQNNGRDNSASNQQTRVVWSEPNLKVDGSLVYDRSSGRIDSDSLQVAGDWFATTLSGGALVAPSFRAAKLTGPARLKMNEVASRLSQLTGTQIRAEGIQETPLEIDVRRGTDGTIAFTIDGQLGWESGEVAGVNFGESNVPFRLTETSINIAPSVIPVGQGQLNVAGEVFYRPGPVWMRLRPGVVAQSVRITPEMADRWLKYLAPLAADAARIDGTFSAELDEAMIVIDDPNASRVSGRMNIEGVQMTAGPLTQQIVSGIEQLKSLSRALPISNGASSDAAPSATKLITMPPQSIEFLLDRGVVSHKTIFFEVDRAQLLTGGQVGLDGRLSLVAQVELDRRWLGGDLQGLAGQGVSLPITGTLSRPRLDSSGVRQVVAQLTTQTIQSAGDTFLKKQLDKSEEYIGDQIGRGLDKLFGR